MNIIFGDDQLADARSKYTVLELDTIHVSQLNKDVTAWCVVESIPIVEMANIDQFQELHENLIKNFKLKNWQYCLDAIEHLTGKWNGELDTYYLSLNQRINDFVANGVDDDWDGRIVTGT